MGRTHRVVVVDGSALLRDALSIRLEGVDDLTVVAHTHDGPEALSLAAEHLPDVIVVDEAVWDAHQPEAMRELHRVSPTTRVVVMSHDGSTRVASAGPHGAVSKQSPFDEFVAELRRVLGPR